MDKTFKEYQKEIAELQKKAIEARRQETAAAIAQIKALMKEFDLSIADLEIRAAKKAEGITSSLPPKFRDPATGATWTGRGRTPAWAAEAKAAGKLASLAIEEAKTASGKKATNLPVTVEKKATTKKVTTKSAVAKKVKKAPVKRIAKPGTPSPTLAEATEAASE